MGYQAQHHVQVVYDAVGSGAGLERIRRREVDFGASDTAMTPWELETAGLLQFPVVIGGVVPVINILGIRPGELRLSGAVLADIYLGRIRKWNDPGIAALNPDIALPNVNITVVHRTEPSGTSLLWSDYLARSSSAWRSRVGAASLTPRWPAGVGGTGNEGIAAYVLRTRFAIGYVEYSYARRHNLSDVALRNRVGALVKAGPDTFRAAADATGWGTLEAVRQLPTDAPGARSWPITGATFILVPRRPDNSERTRAVLQFFDWALHHGGTAVRELDYVPIPEAVVGDLPSLWGTIRDREGQAVWP